MTAAAPVDPSSTRDGSDHRRVPPAVAWVLGAGAFVAAVGIVVWTIASNLTSDLTLLGGALWDFRDASYYSVTAWFDGLVPWDVASYFDTYPVAQEFSLLPPTYLVLHAPFQLLSFVPATVAIVALNVVGCVAMAAWSLRLARYRVTPIAILIASAVVIVSNGGRNVIYNGQTSLVFAAGVYLALTASSAGPGSVGVFVALIKPAFGIPVAALLLAAGRVRRAVIGVVAATVTSALLMVPFIARAGGLGALIEVLVDNISYTADSPWFAFATTTSRIDATATLAMVFDVEPPPLLEAAIGLLVLGVAAWAIGSRRSVLAGRTWDVVIVLVCVATLLTVYHSVYDLVLLILPTFLVVRRDFAGGIPGTLRWTVAGALLFAAFNPFKWNSVVGAITDSLDVNQLLGPGLTGLALLIAFVGSVIALRGRGEPAE